MTTERDPRTRTVLSWLREDQHENAERVLLRALDEVDATPQRRSWWPAWRSQDVNTQIKALLAVAAVAVVAFVGYQLLPSNNGGAGGQRSPLPSSTSSPAPSSGPTASADSGPARLPTSGPIEAGTYQMGSGPTFLITVPPGWTSRGGLDIRKHYEESNEVALFVYRRGISVFADACASEGTEEPIGPTAEDLITALNAQANSNISDPVDVTIAGLPGFRLEISAAAGLDTSQCSIGSLQIWVDSSGDQYLSGLGPEGHQTAYLADTPGGRLLFVPHGEATATTADIAELDAMIASIELVE